MTFYFVSRPTFYSISLAAISVDAKAMPVEFAAVVDSGSSFTYLADPAYTLLTAKASLDIAIDHHLISCKLLIRFVLLFNYHGHLYVYVCTVIRKKIICIFFLVLQFDSGVYELRASYGHVFANFEYCYSLR